MKIKTLKDYEIKYLTVALDLKKFQNEHLEKYKLDLETHMCYIVGLQTITKIEQYRTFPIKNKNIAIKNILKFLKYINKRLDTDKINNEINTLLTIHSDILIEFFSEVKYKAYMILLAELNIITAVPYKNGKFYEISKYPMQYRVHSNYIDDDPCIVISLSELFDFYDLKLKTSTYYNVKLRDTIKNIKIDFINAINAEIEYHNKNNTTINSLIYRIQKILSLNGDRYIKYGTKVNRIY